MKKKKEAPSVHDLRDRPVPPVKGAVTDRQDVLIRPEGSMAPALQARLDDTGIIGSWL